MYHTLRDDSALELEVAADRIEEMRAINATEPATLPVEPKAIVCRVGLTPGGCFIESPRTGRRVTFDRIIPALRPLSCRIAQQVSIGTLRVEFTRDELAAVKAIVDAAAEHEARKNENPPLHFGMYGNGLSKYHDFTFHNPGKRERGTSLRVDDTFDIPTRLTDWPPLGNALWFRHPNGPAMVIAGEAIATLPESLRGRFGGKWTTFTGEELNILDAAAVATTNETRRRTPVRRRRFF